MTIRSLVLGLLGALFVVSACYLARHMPGVTPGMRGHLLTRGHLPISVFGLLFIGVMVVNPLLFLVRRKLRLRAAELAVVLALVLVGCGIADAGLMRFFTPTLARPVHNYRLSPGWRKHNLLQYAPAELMVQDPAAVQQWLVGLGRPGQAISLAQVPWQAWRQPLVAWTPLVVLMSLAVICLAVVVHRQWAQREAVRYPIAEFTASILRQDADRASAPIFRSRPFRITMIAVLAVHVVNGLHLWFPDQMIEIPLVFDFSAIGTKFPRFIQTPNAYYLTAPRIYFTAVAFSYFLASDISLSLGIGNLISVGVTYFLLRAGVDMAGGYMVGGVTEWLTFGSYAGFAMMIAYIGRRYYGLVLRQALTFGRHEETVPAAVWACRLFLLASAALVAYLIRLGLQWPMAVCLVLFSLLLFLVMGRLTAECGLFFYKPTWLAAAPVLGLLGLPIVGPQGLIILGLLTAMWMGDPFECLMPFVTNALRIADLQGVRSGRTGLGMAGVYVLALAMAVGVALWSDHDRGAAPQTSDAGVGWGFGAAETGVTKLKAGGRLETVVAYSGLQRVLHAQPARNFWLAAGTGLVAVLAISWLRLRFSWWPLHQVVLLGFGAWTMGKYSASFLLGWMIKAAVTRLGGARIYRRGRQAMIGAVAGDMLGGVSFLVAAWIYTFLTGRGAHFYSLW